MGMRFDTAYNHRERAIRLLADLYQSAKIFGMTSRRICERSLEIKETIKHCPHWVRSYVDGWEQAVNDGFKHELIFCYTVAGEDGKPMLVSNRRDRDDYYEKRGFGPKEVYEQATHSGHYWDIKGELRPYFVRPMHCLSCGGDLKQTDHPAMDDPAFNEYCTPCAVKEMALTCQEQEYEAGT